MNDLALLGHIAAGKEQASLAIAARGLVKRFGAVPAVNGIDLEVRRGTIFAILGPNGAGKTTLMRMLATLTAPDEGAAVIMGHDLITEPQMVRGAIAMTGQFASLDEDLTGRENLLLLARLWGFRGREARARADDLLAAFDPLRLREQAGEAVFRRHAAPVGHRRLADRDTRGALSRRADDGARPERPPGCLAHDP
jgi:daunorubicin/doxorubicin transport system ATP-binding protein